MSKYFLAFSCLALLGCGPESIRLRGTYTLGGITLVRGGVTVMLSAPDVTGSLTFTQSRYTVSYSAPDMGVMDTDSGTYTLSGSTITLTSDDGTSVTAQTGRGPGLFYNYRWISISESAIVEGETVSLEIFFAE